MRAGMTLREVSMASMVSLGYLSEIERGVKDPSSEMIDAVAGALGVTLVDLADSVAGTLRASTPAKHEASASAGVFLLAA